MGYFWAVSAVALRPPWLTYCVWEISGTVELGGVVLVLCGTVTQADDSFKLLFAR